MKSTTFAVLALCSTAFAATAWAHKDHFEPAKKEAAMPMDAMKPAAEMGKMSGMLGTWSCDGKSADMGKPTQHAIKSTMKMTSELGGHWVMVDYAEDKTKQNPMPFAFKEVIGWDRASGKYHRIFIDNMGGTAMMTASPAAADGKMEWSGDAVMGDRKVPMKDVITMKGEKETLVDVTMQSPDGAWIPVANMTCRK